MIEARHLSKVFVQSTAVDDVSFTVRAGEIFALLGPNGAGKSTTIKMMTTLLRPTRGSISVNGFDTVHQANDVRRTLGIVFQDSSLDGELSVAENMEIHGVLYDVPRRLRRERSETLLRFVELWDRKDVPVKTLSGGMKRRLEIARGFLHEPRVIFLDEPTLGLDTQTRSHMWEYLRQLNADRGTTVLFTTHYMDEAERIAQRIAIIDLGKIVALGTAGELKRLTGATSLEEAFLSLTGKRVRDESADPAELMRVMLRNQAGRR